jgi:large subunit ribosomal protein L4
MELTILNAEGQETSRKAKLAKGIFGIEPNDHAIYLDVKHHLANRRQGTSKAKGRSEVAGSRKKIHRQKGTGGARHASVTAPIFVGGGRVFGPQPRDYGFKLNKKVKRLARRSALSYKASEKSITVVENLSFEKPQTSRYKELLGKLSIGDKKTLLVVGEPNNNLYLSSRNLKRSKVVTASDINTYDILDAQHLVLAEGALPVIETALKDQKGK